jgi:hypothetical protein
MDLLTEKVTRDNIHLRIYDPPVNGYMTAEVLDKASDLWEQAEKSVATNRELQQRVRIARLGLDYAFIERAKAAGDIFVTHRIDHATFTISLDPAVTYHVERFFQLCQAAKITHLNEGGLTPAEYAKALPATLTSTAPKVLVPAQPLNNQRTRAGLRYQYFQGSERELMRLSASAKPLKEGVSKGLDLAMRGRDGEFAVVFTGLLRVPADGVYGFDLDCSGHAMVSIAGQQVFTRDASARGASHAYLALKAGLHPVMLRGIQPGGGTPRLALSWQGPNLASEPIPAAAWCHGGTEP